MSSFETPHDPAQPAAPPCRPFDFRKMQGIFLVGELAKLNRKTVENIFTPDVVLSIIFWQQGLLIPPEETACYQSGNPNMRSDENITFIRKDGLFLQGVTPLSEAEKCYLNFVVQECLDFLGINVCSPVDTSIEEDITAHEEHEPTENSNSPVDLNQFPLLTEKKLDKMVNKLITEGFFRETLNPAQTMQVIKRYQAVKLGELVHDHVHGDFVENPVKNP